MSVIYSENWNDMLRQPLRPMSEGEARRRHEAGEPYVAYVHEHPGGRDAVVELALFVPTVAVSFLDANRDRSTTYAFTSDGDAGLFLSEMALQTFGPDGLAETDEHHRFSTDGLIRVTRRDFRTGEERSWKQRIGDFAPLFEPIPSFGDYDSITRYDR